MSSTFDQARDFFLAGIRHYGAGRFEAARTQFEASLSLVPGRASTLMNLGATLIKLGQFSDAAVVLADAVRADPNDAQAWGHLATAQAELGERANALASAESALRLDPTMAPVWTLKGSLLRDLGRDAEAAPCFREALAHGGDAEMNRYFLAAAEQRDAPATAPRAYVQALFDSYAPGFERHVVEVLGYRAPEDLVNGLGSRRFRSALDLGCGTGLVGARLAGSAQALVGVDVSANMVAQARARGVYSDVILGDAVEFLRTTERRFDLVVAADVFIYVGELEPVFAGVQRVLDAQGVFAFTVELAPDEERMVLRPSMRYAHSCASIVTLAERFGFDVAQIEQQPIREDQQVPIDGLLVWLNKR